MTMEEEKKEECRVIGRLTINRINGDSAFSIAQSFIINMQFTYLRGLLA